MKKPNKSFRQSGKSDQFQKELEILKEKGVYFVSHTPFHIKVEDINYYSSGVVNFDGSPKLDRKGLNFFLEVLESEGFIKDHTPKSIPKRTSQPTPHKEVSSGGVYLLGCSY